MTEPDMIERVARAVLKRDMEQRREIGMQDELSNYEWDDLSPAVQDMRRGLAEAAIEAMREPTPAMVRASWRTVEVVPKDQRMAVLLMSSQSAHEIKALNRWRAMIDAALSPHPVRDTSKEEK